MIIFLTNKEKPVFFFIYLFIYYTFKKTIFLVKLLLGYLNDDDFHFFDLFICFVQYQRRRRRKEKMFDLTFFILRTFGNSNLIPSTIKLHADKTYKFIEILFCVRYDEYK